MSQANKYPNYKPPADWIKHTLEQQLRGLIKAAEANGLVLTIELQYTELAAGHYKMVPMVRGARTLCHDKAANRALAAAGIDPLSLVPNSSTKDTP